MQPYGSQPPPGQPPSWQQPPNPYGTSTNPYGTSPYGASPYGAGAAAPPTPQPHSGYHPTTPAQQPGTSQPGYYMGYRLASWGARVGASLIDALVIMPLMLVAAIAAFMGMTTTITPAPDLASGGTTTATFSPAAVAVMAICYLGAMGLGLYNSVFRQGRTGQSWGKQALKLKLVTTKDGRPMGAGMVFVRNLVHLVDQLPFFPLSIGYLFPLWDPMRQTFADKICSSVVLADIRPAGR